MAYASVIAGSAAIRGNVRGDTSLEILGRVEGDVAVTGDLSIGPDAVVVGTIAGARVLVAGSVEGDITASDAVVVADTGRVVGDVVAPRIGMSEGAHVRGNVRTEGAPARSTPRAVSEPRSAPVERPRAVVAAAPPPPPLAVAVPAGATPRPPAVGSAVKKAPPPPVIPAPRPGVRARKKLARR